MRRRTNVDLMLAHRLRLWANIKSTLAQCPVFAETSLTGIRHMIAFHVYTGIHAAKSYMVCSNT